MTKQIKKFIIDHIDPLGQGVFKEGEEIFFIPKVLPKEEGTFEILKTKKGVNLGRLLELTKSSELRSKPECEHFDKCPGCHFQHMDYKTELEFKTNTFRRLLKRISESPEISLIPSTQRFHYRNRVQLHYNVKEQKIGFLDAKSQDYIEPTNCIISNQNVQNEVDHLLNNSNWIKKARKLKQNKGHVEVYFNNFEVKINWNKKYSDGGFTQVNKDTNDLFKETLKKIIPSNSNILDLFGGNGNMSDLLEYKNRMCIDIYKSQSLSDDFISLDLFNSESLDDFKAIDKIKDFDLIVIDPPRSGFKNISSWINAYPVKTIAYISCNAQTLVRDIQEIHSEYKVKSAFLIDFFPATYHFESCIILEKR